jgi:hypothetical protein
MSSATDPKAVCLDWNTLLGRSSVSQSDPTPLRRPVLGFTAVPGRIAGHTLAVSAITASNRLTIDLQSVASQSINEQSSHGCFGLHLCGEICSLTRSCCSSVVLVCNIRTGKHITPTIPSPLIRSVMSEV